MLKTLSNGHKMLIRLLWLNVAFDLLSIPFWFTFTYVQNPISQSTLNVNPILATVDAAIAVALFAVSLFGVMQNRKWGSVLAIAATVLQRVVGVFIFQLNVGMAVEVVWSALIVYFAFRNFRQPQKAQSTEK